MAFISSNYYYAKDVSLFYSFILSELSYIFYYKLLFYDNYINYYFYISLIYYIFEVTNVAAIFCWLSLFNDDIFSSILLISFYTSFNDTYNY